MPGPSSSFFSNKQPETGNGFARLADALSATGRAPKRSTAARAAWASADLSAADEQAIFARYGASLSWQDHDLRTDALLFAKDPTDAQRFLPMTSATRRAAFTARVAMQSRWPDAETRYQAVIGQVTTDAGLMMDRARYLRDANWESAARQLFARDHAFTYRPADPERFLDMQILLADGAAQEGSWSLAYNIARQTDDVLAPGVDCQRPEARHSRQIYVPDVAGWNGGVERPQPSRRRDDYVRSLFARRPFASGAVERPVLGRQGRALRPPGHRGHRLFPARRGLSGALLRPARARAARTADPSAGAAPDFCGQSNAEDGILDAAARPGDAARSASKIAREQTLFVRALAESLNSDSERVVATQFGQQIGREDLGVWVARMARVKGSAFYVETAYPRLPAAVSGARMWSLAHGITRQESSFDRAASATPEPAG